MTGVELLTRVGFGVRDFKARTYPMLERFAYLQEGVSVVAQELARRKSAAVRAVTEVNLTGASLARPGDCLAMYTVLDAAGQPLPMGGMVHQPGLPLSWRVTGGELVFQPAPLEPVSLTLVYGARPALAGLALPADDAAALLAADVEIPFAGRMDLPLIEFVKMRCLNRNEYDVNTELGLYRLLLSQAADLAAVEDLAEDRPTIERYDFSGGAA